MEPEVTFGEVVDHYLASTSIDPASRGYCLALKAELGGVKIPELRRRFDKFLLTLKKRKVKGTEKLLTDNTINHYISWAKIPISSALRAGLINDNPLQYVRKYRTYPRDRLLTEEEKGRLLEAFKAEAEYLLPIVQFSLLVPSRRGELLSLKRTDYDPVKNVIVIPSDRTKKRRPVIKPVPQCLVEYMKSVPQECPWLFYRKKGGEYLPLGNFRATWNKILKGVGIENYRFHDQRRTAYTSLLNQGNSPFDVMQVSGHSSDMSKVYFGRNEMKAAQRIKF
jgi:integrase